MRAAEAVYEGPVFLPSDSGDVFGVLTRPGSAETRQVLVMVPGIARPESPAQPCFGKNQLQTRLARSMASAGWAAFRIDALGSGDSADAASQLEPGNADGHAVESVARWLHDQGLTDMALMGVGFGARSALASVSQLEGVVGIALVSAPLLNYTRSDVKAFELWQPGRPPDWVDATVLDGVEATVQREVPLLFLYGRDDGLYTIFERARHGRLGHLLGRGGDLASVRTTRGALLGHVDVMGQEELITVVAEWLQRLPDRSRTVRRIHGLREGASQPFNSPTAASVLPDVGAELAGFADAPTALEAAALIVDNRSLWGAWRDAGDLPTFLERQFTDEASPLLTIGREINGALVIDHASRMVLYAIAQGARSKYDIVASCPLPAAVLQRSLFQLMSSGLVCRDIPLPNREDKEPRYRVKDPLVGFWIRNVMPVVDDIRQGRIDLAVREALAIWRGYRDRAMLALVRPALERLVASDDRLSGVRMVGGDWTRASDFEVDLVGVDGLTADRTVFFVGALKWSEKEPFTAEDLQDLETRRLRVPGASSARLVVVCRSGCCAEGVDVSYCPEDLLAAWR